MSRVNTLRDELLNDPLSVSYSLMTDQQTADSLNANTYSNANPITAIYEYLFNKNHRTNQGADSQYVPIIGRLAMAADSAIGSDPFGRGTGNEINLIQKTACITLQELLRSPNAPAIDFTDTGFPLGSVNGAGVISSAHINNITALSQNQISRGVLIGAGVMIRSGEIAEARA